MEKEPMPKKLPPVDTTRVPWEAAFARALSQHREARGMSQTELARQVTDSGQTLHQTTIARIENGTRSVNLNEALAIASVLDADPLEMAQFTAEPEDPIQLSELATDRAQDVARASFSTVFTAWSRLNDAVEDAERWAVRAKREGARRAAEVGESPSLKKWEMHIVLDPDHASLANALRRIEENDHVLKVLNSLAGDLEVFVNEHSDDNMRPIVGPATNAGEA